MSGLIYLDTSAILKRIFVEDESLVLRDHTTKAVEAGDRFVTSALALVEVSRATRRRLDHEPLRELQRAIEEATSDIAIVPIDDRIIESARIIGPPLLRSLDAIHLAAAVAVGARELWTYDDRLAASAEGMGIPAVAPM